MRHPKRRFIALLAVFLTPGLAVADDPADDRIADLFALRLTVSESPRPGGTVEALIEAFHPYTGEPLTGLEVNVRVSSEDRKLGEDRKVTDARGEAAFAVPIPDDASGGFVVTATGTWRGQSHRTTNSFWGLHVLAHDPLSGHTETRKLTRRVAAEALRLELKGSLAAPGRPGRAWVVTRWADGRPASCDVEIRRRIEGGEEVTLERLRTDRYGVARPGAPAPEAGELLRIVATAEPATDPASLRAFLDSQGVDLSGIYDPWGSTYCFRFSIQGANRRLAARSAGRDRLWGTLDDLDAWTYEWPFGRRLGHDVTRALARRFDEDGTFVLDDAGAFGAVAGL